MSCATTMPNTALILRTCKADMTSWDGFKWPRRGKVEAPDWEPTRECGNGLHGLLWGEGGGGCLLDWSEDAVWIVARVDMDDVINLGDKVKFPRATVLYAGDRKTATDLILKERPGAACVGAFVTGGYRATVTGGYRATVTGGDYATVTGGYRTTATGGDYATVTGGGSATVTGGHYATVTGGFFATVTGGFFAAVTGGHYATVTGGDYATVTGGQYATVTGGDYATVTGGQYATVTGGDGSVLQLRHYDGRRWRIVTAYVGKDGIKPDTPYRLVGVKFTEWS
jgi:hypothetical protein